MVISRALLIATVRSSTSKRRLMRMTAARSRPSWMLVLPAPPSVPSFSAMKGAADGGLHVPHSNKRFPGYRAPEEKGAEAEFDAEALRDRILGKHVAEYMETMEEEDQQKYESHFAKYIEEGITADDIEDMYVDAHKAIRENPERVPAE